MSARLVKAMQSAGKLELPPLTSWKTDSPQIEPLVQSPHSPPDIDLTDERTASTARRDVMIGGGWEGSSTSSQKKTKDSISLQNSSASSLSEGQTVFLPPSTCPDSTGPNGFQEPSEFQSEQGDQSSSQQSDLIYGRQSNEDGPSTSGHPAPETELLFLGTSSGAPTLSRNVSGLLLKMKRGTWLFDCGEGTQHRLLRARVPPSAISKIFISHMHGDHIFGLPGLLLSIMDSRDELGLSKDEPLHIYGPKGLGQYIWANLSMSASGLTTPVTVHELGHDAPGALSLDSRGRFQVHPVLRIETPGGVVHWDLFDGDRLSAKASLLRHRVPCYGYVVEETYERKVDPLRAKGWGLQPGPTFAKLERGESVRLPNGTVVRPDDVLEAPTRRKVCILGDTCDSSNMTGVARNADVLVHEATFENKYEEKALVSTHSTAGMAGAFAREIGAKLLILTHFSKRYESLGSRDVALNSHSGNEAGDVTSQAVRRLVTQAMSTFRSNKVVAAEDLKRIQVSRSVFVDKESDEP